MEHWKAHSRKCLWERLGPSYKVKVETADDGATNLIWAKDGWSIP